IGLLMGFPPLALTILAIVGLALTITYILVSNGWVENTKNGFNWKLCLPEFMQKKLRVDEKPKPGVDLMNIHEGITPQIHMLKIGSVVEEKEATPFRAPPELEKEPERKLAFWEKLKAKFKKEKKVIIEETKRPVSHPVKDSETLSLSDAMAMQGILRIGSHRAHKLPNTPEGGSR
ncbi:MAG: hypothetical protein ACRDFB_10740, partial [Rhabdochlamydiaceae bacterium]